MSQHKCFMQSRENEYEKNGIKLTRHNHSHSYYGSSNIKVSDIKWQCLWEFSPIHMRTVGKSQLFFSFFFYPIAIIPFLSPFGILLSSIYLLKWKFWHLSTQCCAESLNWILFFSSCFSWQIQQKKEKENEMKKMSW